MLLTSFSDSLANLNYIDLSITFVVVLLIGLLSIKISKRYFLFISYIVIYLLLVVAKMLDYQLLYSVVELAFFVGAAGFVMIYLPELTALFAKKLNKRYFENFDEERKNLFIEIIDNAVLTLSATKTGAIMTFERKDNLDEYIAKGEPINAPVTSELLRTIFYEGTPLHDGAVIIREDVIKAASVYYTPTTQPLVGKFGARHRAAIGFSEFHDSITVVVSEETGRISFAIGGELISVSRDVFKKRFAEYLEK